MDEKQLKPDPRAFDYDIVTKKKVSKQIGGKEYVAGPAPNSIFINLTTENRSNEDLGWKIHISLLETPENLRKAWNLIVDVLTSYGIEASKVLKKWVNMPEFQLGKEITIYCQRSEVNWNKMLQEISTLFIRNGVLPNYNALIDKAIPGSIYFSCRTDKDRRGKSVMSLEVDTHNPSGKPHYFEDLKINQSELPSIQLPKPVRNNEQNIKIFYRMLYRNLKLTIDNLYSTFDRSLPKLHTYSDDTFLDAIKKLYEVSEVDVNLLRSCLNRLNALKQQFEKGIVQIESLSANEFNGFYEKCANEFISFNASIKEIMEHILKAEAEKTHSDSDEGSVKIHSSDDEKELPRESDALYHENILKGKDDADPGGGSAHKEKEESTSSKSELKQPIEPNKPEGSIAGSSGHNKTHQYFPLPQPVASRSFAAVHGRPESGMERMIIAISDITGLPEEEIEKLEAHQIKNIFKIIQIQKSFSDPVSDVIISALEKRQVSLAQIQDINDETKKKMDVILKDKCTSHTLKIGDVMTAFETIKKRNTDINVAFIKDSSAIDKDQSDPSPKFH